MNSQAIVGIVVGAVLLGGCMKPQIEQTIKNNELLTVHSDANFWSPSFTLPVRSRCVLQEGITTVIKIDGETHTCYGTFVEVQHLPVGYQDGMGSALGDGVVTAGSAALIMHGLRGMGDKDSNNTTNNNDTDSNGGVANGGSSGSFATGGSSSAGASSSSKSFSRSSSSAKGGSVNMGKKYRR